MVGEQEVMEMVRTSGSGMQRWRQEPNASFTGKYEILKNEKPIFHPLMLPT